MAKECRGVTPKTPSREEESLARRLSPRRPRPLTSHLGEGRLVAHSATAVARLGRNGARPRERLQVCQIVGRRQLERLIRPGHEAVAVVGRCAVVAGVVEDPARTSGLMGGGASTDAGLVGKVGELALLVAAFLAGLVEGLAARNHDDDDGGHGGARIKKKKSRQVKKRE